jgi:serine/threonine-protein kinase RsbT
MAVLRTEILPLRSSTDVLAVRQAVRTVSRELGFGLVDQTKLVTATSELARNVVDYAGSGTARIESLNEGPRRGVRVVFEDHGPGIADVEQALRDGFSTGGGLGLGLGGARRLSNDFEIQSSPGHGTRVAITRWR